MQCVNLLMTYSGFLYFASSRNLPIFNDLLEVLFCILNDVETKVV